MKTRILIEVGACNLPGAHGADMIEFRVLFTDKEFQFRHLFFSERETEQTLSQRIATCFRSVEASIKRKGLEL